MPKSYSVGLVGEANYQAAIADLREGERVTLEPEPGNPHDPRAIVCRDGEGATIGYVPRDHWLTAAMIDEGKAARATVEAIHGGERGRPSRGVVIAVELAAGGAGSGESAAVPKATAPTTGSKSPKQVMGCGIVAIVALLALPSMCSGDDDDAGAETEVAATAAAVDPASLAAEKAKCAGLIEGLVETGLIRDRKPGTITVEESNWEQVPYKDKVNVLIGAFCAETGRQTPERSEKMSAYGYRSGDRLLTLTESGVF